MYVSAGRLRLGYQPLQVAAMRIAFTCSSDIREGRCRG
jgi:hypothetical protein